jgi:hypothetical protein
MKVALRLGIAVLVGVIAAWFTFQYIPPELSRAQFMAEVRAGHVRKVVIHDEEVITGESSTRGRFRTPFKKEEDAQLVTELRERGVEVVYETSPEGLI